MSRCDFKIVLLGSEHVGKTSLVLRFVHCRFNANTPYQNTIGAAFCAKTMHSNGKNFTVGIWDTAGSERYEAMTKMYYRGAHAAIICYEPSSYASWIRLRHWLQELRTIEEDCKVYLCATKKDLLDSLGVERQVPEDIVMTYSQGLSGHFETSSKTGENVVITLATKPRSVNLNLETTFEFNNKQDVSIIQKVRNFLNKIENAVDTKLAKRNGETTEFTNFLQDLISTVNSYDDDDFKQVFRVLDDVANNFKSKDNKFNEIYNERLKYILTGMLKKINKAPAKFLRSQLKKNLRFIQKKDVNVEFLNFLNKIYKKKSSTALKQTLDNFKNYGKKTRTSDVDLNLRDIIDKAVKSLVHDQYYNLNEDTQQHVHEWIKTLTKNPDDDELENSPKNKTPKKHSYKKKKQETIREKYTFVTLYPEMITYNIKYIDETSRQKKKEKTIKEKYNDYKVKEFSPVLNNDGFNSSSSSSLEYDWQTRPTPKKIVTPTWHTIPRPLKIKFPRNQPVRINNNPYKFHLPHMLRRTELEEKDINKTKNETCPKEINSANYLSKIKKLEEELHRVREQLKAKITTLKKDTGDIDKKKIKKITNYSSEYQIYLLQ
ncbi:Ras-related protein Rab-24 [Papilio machaon]|uniref:Ras-related protein Rab-24 n=1 Tax=Papilio machaon TaxID=76193 RepID=A0A0N0PEA2_PAPMA|nr:Ras-related protein Rab-24 [Papilio machaon]